MPSLEHPFVKLPEGGLLCNACLSFEVFTEDSIREHLKKEHGYKYVGRMWIAPEPNV